MDTRLFAFAENHQLGVPAQQELLQLVSEIVQESLEAGHSVLDWEADPSRPLSFGDFGGGAQFQTSSGLDTFPPSLSSKQRHLTAEERYETLGTLGIGSMGEVRKVRDRQLKRVVAMKVMRDELLEDDTLIARFIEEAQATAQLQHPGVIPLLDLGQLEDGRYFFTMKEIKGRTLQDVISDLHSTSRYHGHWHKTHDDWTFRKLLDAFRSVCDTLSFAHARGVIHRDLKPENVMLGDYGEVLVLDWGLVKVTHDEGELDDFGAYGEQVVSYRAQDDKYATVAGALIGTPMYMSPEQALGDDDLDMRCDVYGLGALLYELMSGLPPYQGNDYVEVLEKILSEPPPPLIYTQEQLQQAFAANPYFRMPLPLPEELVEICTKAMARDPNARYQDATELAQAVGEWLEGEAA